VTTAPGLQRNQSLQRGADLLRALGDARDGATATALARAVGLPLPTVRRLLATLADAGLAERVAGGGLWVVGSELIRIGRAADPHLAAVARARPHLEALAAATGESAVLGASRLPQAVDVLVQLDPPRTIGIGSWVGRSFGLHASAGARIAFAALDDPTVRAILGPGPLPRYTAATITDPAAFVATLTEVRRSAVAVSIDELEEGLATIAVPVGPIDVGHPYALGLSGPTARFGPERREQLTDALRACAAAIAAA
jgi:IclR family acetate operon transcriptional repressor